MKLLQLWYLATIAIFISLACYVLWVDRRHIFKKHWRFIVLFTLFSTPFAYWDGVAQRWHAYQYNPAHTLNYKVLGGELETYIFMGLVAMVVCSATIIYLREEDRGKLRLTQRSRNKRQKRSKLRKPRPAVAISRR